jgi:hypothetical protein
MTYRQAPVGPRRMCGVDIVPPHLELSPRPSRWHPPHALHPLWTRPHCCMGFSPSSRQTPHLYKDTAPHTTIPPHRPLRVPTPRQPVSPLSILSSSARTRKSSASSRYEPSSARHRFFTVPYAIRTLSALTTHDHKPPALLWMHRPNRNLAIRKIRLAAVARSLRPRR